jgi:hypothetical protein
MRGLKLNIPFEHEVLELIEPEKTGVGKALIKREDRETWVAITVLDPWPPGDAYMVGHSYEANDYETVRNVYNGFQYHVEKDYKQDG